MLFFLAQNCTNILLKYQKIPEDLKHIYIYGFKLFWSTILCIISILGTSILLGYWKSAIIFLIYFIPIRVTIGGYHAKNYQYCFLLTNFLAAFCVLISHYLAYFISNKYIAWILLVTLITYIWISAPVIPKKYLLSQERIKKNRKSIHNTLIIETILLIFIQNFFNIHMFYTAVITICTVVIMFVIAKKEAQ